MFGTSARCQRRTTEVTSQASHWGSGAEKTTAVASTCRSKSGSRSENQFPGEDAVGVDDRPGRRARAGLAGRRDTQTVVVDPQLAQPSRSRRGEWRRAGSGARRARPCRRPRRSGAAARPRGSSAPPSRSSSRTRRAGRRRRSGRSRPTRPSPVRDRPGRLATRTRVSTRRMSSMLARKSARVMRGPCRSGHAYRASCVDRRLSPRGTARTGPGRNRFVRRGQHEVDRHRVATRPGRASRRRSSPRPGRAGRRRDRRCHPAGRRRGVVRRRGAPSLARRHQARARCGGARRCRRWPSSGPFLG